MVGWYNPGQLLRTGTEVLISTKFGRHSDSRRVDGVETDDADSEVDFTKPEYLDTDGSLGFDFVADTGDGFNSTYAVAYSVSQDQCASLPRGKLLLFGGDLVYPYPTREAYEARLLQPYRIASEAHAGQRRNVLAIPGNHDWYDSLVNFRRLFCYRRHVEFWNAPQRRSYFAAKLPHGWWLLGLDVQLDHDIDEHQYDFFVGVAEKIQEGQSAIICVAEPVWHRGWEAAPGGQLSPRLVDDLRDRLKGKAKVWLAGDLHHYQRFSTKDDEEHLITCGMGGAFLHPTHKSRVDPKHEFQHRCSYPTKVRSWFLTLWNLLFVIRNPWFGIVPASAYLLAAWQNGLAVGECFRQACIDDIGEMGLSHFWDAVYSGVHSAILSPTGMAMYVFVFWGFAYFADRTSALFRYVIGPLHAMAHIVVGFFIYWYAAYFAITDPLRLAHKSIEQYLVSGSIIFALGWVLGSIVLGVYLLISLNVFGKHPNEAFSALRIENWKGFLRCRITPEGRLRIWFIGFDKVPWRWQWTYDKEKKPCIRPAKDLNVRIVDRMEI